MSTFVMALAAGMAVGSGPEATSGEVKPPLDLRGWWGGRWEGGGPDGAEVWQVRMHKNVMKLRNKHGDRDSIALSKIVDEGDGKLSFVLGEVPCTGIYRQDGDWLVISFRDTPQARPTSFQAGKDQYLFTLHRVKSGK